MPGQGGSGESGEEQLVAMWTRVTKSFQSHRPLLVVGIEAFAQAEHAPELRKQLADDNERAPTGQDRVDALRAVGQGLGVVTPDVTENRYQPHSCPRDRHLNSVSFFLVFFYRKTPPGRIGCPGAVAGQRAGLSGIRWRSPLTPQCSFAKSLHGVC